MGVRLRVLLVEDQIVLRRVLARSLRVRADVDEAERLHEAFDRVRTATYDIVVTSDELPDGSGRVLLERVLALQSRCRRALMSSCDLQLEPRARTSARSTSRPSCLRSSSGWINCERSCSRAKRHDGAEKIARSEARTPRSSRDRARRPRGASRDRGRCPGSCSRASGEGDSQEKEKGEELRARPAMAAGSCVPTFYTSSPIPFQRVPTIRWLAESSSSHSFAPFAQHSRPGRVRRSGV